VKRRRYITMNVYWFGLAFLWNGLHPIILPALLLRLVPEALKNTYLGGMTFAGLVLAMIVQPLAGALSDRSRPLRSAWGRRRPWMVAGTLLGLGFLAWMAASTTYGWLVAGYLLLQIASNGAHGPAQGLIPDLVPEHRRGLASGIKNLFDMGGLVVTSLVAGQLMGSDNPALAFALIGGVLLVSTAITVLGTPETDKDIGAPVAADADKVPAPDPGVATGDTRALWRVDWRSHRDYAWLLVSRYLILLGIYAVQGFAQYYVRDWLGAPNAAEVTGNLMAAIGLALTLLVFPAGWLSDRMGRWQLNVLAGALAALGIFLLVFARSLLSLYLFGGLIGAATGIFLSVNWALATSLIPAAEAGKYLGLSNLATAGAGATARLAGPLIDGLNALRPGAYLGYPALFVLASGMTLAGTVLLLRIRKAGQEAGTKTSQP
jgi:Na+/melibiose symporter-like transporter